MFDSEEILSEFGPPTDLMWETAVYYEYQKARSRERYHIRRMGTPMPKPGAHPCPGCGTAVDGKQWCSGTCYKRVYMKAYFAARAKPAVERQCGVCAKPFASNFSKKSYCGKKCRRAAAAKVCNARRKAERAKATGLRLKRSTANGIIIGQLMLVRRRGRPRRIS